jgi:hypothetical protein
MGSPEDEFGPANTEIREFRKTFSQVRTMVTQDTYDIKRRILALRFNLLIVQGKILSHKASS